jgi:hypothetical protein
MKCPYGDRFSFGHGILTYITVSPKRPFFVSLPHRPLHSPLGGKHAKQIVPHYPQFIRRLVAFSSMIGFGDGRGGFYHIKRLISESVQSGCCPSLQSQIELKRLDNKSSSSLRFNLDLEWCQRCGHFCHLRHNQNLNLSKLPQVAKSGSHTKKYEYRQWPGCAASVSC